MSLRGGLFSETGLAWRLADATMFGSGDLLLKLVLSTRTDGNPISAGLGW